MNPRCFPHVAYKQNLYIYIYIKSEINSKQELIITASKTETYQTCLLKLRCVSTTRVYRVSTIIKYNIYMCRNNYQKSDYFLSYSPCVMSVMERDVVRSSIRDKSDAKCKLEQFDTRKSISRFEIT